MQRVLTLHIDSKGSLRLTPQVVAVLETVAEQFGRPEMRLRSEGIGIYVHDWEGCI